MKQDQTLNCGAEWKQGWQVSWAEGPNNGLVKCVGKLADFFVKHFKKEKKQGRDADPNCREYSFSRCSVCLFLGRGSSQLQKQNEQKCWGSLKGRCRAIYRNHDDSKSFLQASFIGKQNLVMFRSLPNFWHLRPCDCNVFSFIPVFFADS